MRVYPGAVLQWEDFLKGNAIAQLHRFRDRLCTFNDDIQGTAAVVVSGIYASLRITGKPMRDQKIVLAGAGASAQGIANLVVAALVDEGLTPEQARDRICTVDSRGLVTRDRPNLEAFKATYARPTEEVARYVCRDPSAVTLEETIRNVKPTILLGTSGTPGLFTAPVLVAMAEINERPIVFPLSNPTSQSECTAAEAIRWSVYPELPRIRECSHGVACAVIRRAVLEGHADDVMLRGLEQRVLRAMWVPEYRPIRFEPAADRTDLRRNADVATLDSWS